MELQWGEAIRPARSDEPVALISSRVATTRREMSRKVEFAPPRRPWPALGGRPRPEALAEDAGVAWRDLAGAAQKRRSGPGVGPIRPETGHRARV